MKCLEMACCFTSGLALLVLADHAHAQQHESQLEAAEQDEVARASEIMTSFHVARSAIQQSDDEKFIMGSFYPDIARCVRLFSEQHEPVELENYIVSFRYSGDSVGYLFHALERADSLVRTGANPWPPSPSFSCVRLVSWGDRLLVNVEE